MLRKNTREITIGNVLIGNNHPIVIQSMTNFPTEDTEKNVEQILALEKAGCEIIRLTVPTKEAAESFGRIKKRVHIPCVADIHFDYQIALCAIENGVSKIRINPGNIGSQENIQKKDNIQLKILNGETDINFGAVYENYTAQELYAHGFETIYYYNSKKRGEVDFLIESDGAVLPIEIKSGKSFIEHAALDNLMSEESFGIPSAYVFCNSGEVVQQEKITYLPIYFLMFLEHGIDGSPMIYRIE